MQRSLPHIVQTKGVGVVITNDVETLDNLIDLTHDSIFSWDLDGNIRLWNAGSEELYGWSRRDVVGRNAQDLLNSQLPASIAEVEARFHSGRWEGEIARRTAEGVDVIVEARWTVRRSADGHPQAIIETGRDITARKRADEMMRRSEYRYRNMFQAMAVSFWELEFVGLDAMFNYLRSTGVTDLRAYIADHPEFIEMALDATHVADVNEKTIQLFGAKQKEDLFGSVRPYWPVASRGVFTDAVIMGFSTDIEGMLTFVGIPSFEAETKLATLDGREIDALFTVCWPPESKGKSSLLVGVIDISERVAAREALSRLQSDLAHAARVSMLGELTASIAHEVNQPLAAITTNGEAGLRWLSRAEPNVDEVRQLTGRMVVDARRAADIIARIRAMSTKRAPEHSVISLESVIDEAVTFLRHEILARKVALRLDLTSHPSHVFADRTQLQQVLVNLSINAMQAMAQAEVGEPRLLLRTSYQDGMILTEIVDSGPGISSSDREKIFDSFFSTKPAGMGMGLPICRSIIEAHGGRIWFDSDRPTGTAFCFTLPTVDDLN